MEPSSVPPLAWGPVKNSGVAPPPPWPQSLSHPLFQWYAVHEWITISIHCGLIKWFQFCPLIFSNLCPDRPACRQTLTQRRFSIKNGFARIIPTFTPFPTAQVYLQLIHVFMVRGVQVCMWRTFGVFFRSRSGSETVSRERCVRSTSTYADLEM